NTFSFTTDGSAQVTRGSAQMAIINNQAGPMASNVVRVKFVASNQQTWFRELVVTGTASQSTPAAPGNLVAPVATATAVPGQISVQYGLATNGPGYSYAIQRAVVTNG